MILCEYGCGQEGLFQFKNKKFCCSQTSSSCKAVKEKNSKNSKNRTGNKTKDRLVWNKGLTKDKDSRVAHKDSTKKKLQGISLGKKMSDEFKENRKQEMLKRYANGWEAKCGRTKKFDYESPIAGKIKVDGSWEYKVAEYLDSLNLTWIRNKKRFSYFNSIKNMTSTYCPDFFVNEWNTYIEVKGYETDLDKIKWAQFKSPLEVWDKNKLKELNIIR